VSSVRKAMAFPVMWSRTGRYYAALARMESRGVWVGFQ